MTKAPETPNSTNKDINPNYAFILWGAGVTVSIRLVPTSHWFIDGILIVGCLLWLSAILLQWTPDRRKQLVDTLHHETFTQVYQRIMGPILSWLWSRVRGERVEVGGEV